MNSFFIGYMFLWSGACLIALWLGYIHRKDLLLLSRDYLQYVTVPWKLSTFIIAISGMTIIAPYTGDPTWDYFDAFFMSLLTWYTAPWALGTIFKSMQQRKNYSQLYIALCCWLFVVSWSYDLYILLRDGIYPATWWSNLLLSSVLYTCAGLMWNLEYWPKIGMEFGFMRDNWPIKPRQDQFAKIFWFALPFMLLVSVLILAFVIPIPFLSF